MCENFHKTAVCGLKLRIWQNQSADVFVFLSHAFGQGFGDNIWAKMVLDLP